MPATTDERPHRIMPLRRLVTLFVALAAASATTVLAAQPALAASDAWANGYLRLHNTCAGLGYSNRLRNDELASGVYLRVYYSTAQGGTNCANLINTSGRARDLDIYISYLDPDGGGAWDRGRYSSYAGSVLLKGTSGSCIDIIGSIDGREFFTQIGGRACA